MVGSLHLRWPQRREGNRDHALLLKDRVGPPGDHELVDRGGEDPIQLVQIVHAGDGSQRESLDAPFEAGESQAPLRVVGGNGVALQEALTSADLDVDRPGHQSLGRSCPDPLYGGCEPRAIRAARIESV